PVRRPAVEARGDAAVIAPSVEGEEPPRAVLGLPEGALANGHRPGRADRLVAAPRVDGMHVADDPVPARLAACAVDCGVCREVHATAFPAVAGDEPLAAHGERPRRVSRVLATGDLGPPVDR